MLFILPIPCRCRQYGRLECRLVWGENQKLKTLKPRVRLAADVSDNNIAKQKCPGQAVCLFCKKGKIVLNHCAMEKVSYNGVNK